MVKRDCLPSPSCNRQAFDVNVPDDSVPVKEAVSLGNFGTDFRVKSAVTCLMREAQATGNLSISLFYLIDT